MPQLDLPHPNPERLVLLALGEFALTDDDRHHLEGCDACRSEYDSLAGLVRVGRETREVRTLPEPPATVWAAIVAATGQRPATHAPAGPVTSVNAVPPTPPAAELPLPRTDSPLSTGWLRPRADGPSSTTPPARPAPTNPPARPGHDIGHNGIDVTLSTGRTAPLHPSPTGTGGAGRPADDEVGQQQIDEAGWPAGTQPGGPADERPGGAVGAHRAGRPGQGISSRPKVGRLPASAGRPEPGNRPESESRPAAGGRPAAGRRQRSGPDRRPRWVQAGAVAVAAAAVAVMATLGVSRLTGQQQQPPTVTAQADLIAFGSTPTVAHGSAVISAASGSSLLELHVSNLPASGGYYEVWLIDPDNKEMIAVGILGGQSDVVLPLPASIDLHSFRLVDISAEPLDGNPAHSGHSLLRGALNL